MRLKIVQSLMFGKGRILLGVCHPHSQNPAKDVYNMACGKMRLSMAILVHALDVKGELMTTMSDDLISRQQAIEALDCINGVEEVLRSLPPVQPERKKGEWIEISSINHTYRCSECGRLLVNVTDGRNNVSKHYPYCHCGADMRGEKDERTD